MTTAQFDYNNDVDKNLHTFLRLGVGYLVYVNKAFRAVYAPEVDNGASASCNKVMTQVSGRYKLDTARDTDLATIQNGIENTVSTAYSSQAPGLNENCHVNANRDYIFEVQTLTQNTETP